MRNLNKNKTRSKLFRLAMIIIIIGAFLYQKYGHEKYGDNINYEFKNSQLEYAIENQLSDTQVQGVGIVIKVLPDDTRGSQHQRFLLKLANDHVILIAHNIDLAPRIENLENGDRVSFNGEFEWNDKGGVVHWTHHDPKNRHPHGWLERGEKRYQ